MTTSLAAGTRPLATSRGVLGRTSGVVYVEYLASAIPLFIMFLCFIQLAISFAAGIVVQHAANMAARSAITVISDYDTDDFSGQQRYGGAPRLLSRSANQTTLLKSTPTIAGTTGSRSDERITFLMRGLQFSGGDGAAGWNAGSIRVAENLRLQTIFWAAMARTTAVSPNIGAIAGKGQSVKNAFNPMKSEDIEAADGETRLDWIGQMASYAAQATTVNVAILPGTPTTPTSVRVTVGFLFRCGVPVADLIVCPAGPVGMPNFPGDVTFSPGGGPGATTALGGQFRLLLGQATLPLQNDIFIPGAGPEDGPL